MNNNEKKTVGIKQLPESERPYERFSAYGPDALSDSELLAIILRSGTPSKNSLELARELLAMNSDRGGLAGLLNQSESELKSIPGIGKVKSAQILCIGELARRMSRCAAKDGITLNSPSAIADYYMEEMRHLRQEEMHMAMFDSRGRLLHSSMLSRGTVNASLVSPREIFMEAMKYNAVSVILLHNHPSGDSTPSSEDLILTKRIAEAGTILHIPLMDHIIIGDKRYCSFKESGYL